MNTTSTLLPADDGPDSAKTPVHTQHEPTGEPPGPPVQESPTALPDECTDAAPSRTPPPLGAALRLARESAGLSLDTLSIQLKYSRRQLEAMEAGNYSALPSDQVFLKGMVRGYARYTQTDPHAWFDQLNGECPHKEIALELPPGIAQSQAAWVHKLRSPSVHLLASACLLLCVAIGLALFYGGHQNKPAPVRPKVPTPSASAVDATPLNPVPSLPTPAAQDIPKPLSASPAPSIAPLSGQRELSFVFHRESWVEIKNKQGETLFVGLNPPQTKRTIRGAPPLSLVVGNAAHVHLTIDGQDVDLAPHTAFTVARLDIE
jgi:cytoskeleton protein RodZ